MFTRTTGLFIFPMWLAAMGWLVAHDVWPTLTALPAPPLTATEWLKTDGLQSRYTIVDDLGPLGTAWSEYLVADDSIRRDDLVWLERFPVVRAPVRIAVTSVYRADGTLDELTIRAENREAGMRLHGERFHTDFSFIFESGPLEKAFKIPLTEGSMISGAFHPFSALTNLRVGQRWRMQVVNPIAALTGVGSRFTPVLVEVTGEERIETPAGSRNCLIIESENSKAWIDANGAVLVQEMTVPIVGRLRMIRQADFDDDGRAAARSALVTQ